MTFFPATSTASHTLSISKEKKKSNYEYNIKILKLHKDMGITRKLKTKPMGSKSSQLYTANKVVGQINKLTQ